MNEMDRATLELRKAQANVNRLKKSAFEGKFKACLDCKHFLENNFKDKGHCAKPRIDYGQHGGYGPWYHADCSRDPRMEDKWEKKE